MDMVMKEEAKGVIASPSSQIATTTGIDSLLQQIRPQWQAKSLIERVKRLVPVDPSSACQRLLNAAIHDLREKIVIAGLDIAGEAATAHKLPSVAKQEDILENYSTSHALDLAYRMGLLSRPEWRRLRRTYDIRRDLEHEDNEYEAQLEDVVYVFKTCIEIVLSQEPIELPRVKDIKDLIEAPKKVGLSLDLLRDYEKAPDPRQKEINKFLVNSALDESRADVTRQNAVEALRSLEPLTLNTVKIGLAAEFQERAKRKPFVVAQIKVAAAGGFLPYLKQRQVEAFFQDFYDRFKKVGYHWQSYPEHGNLLDDFEDLGGLGGCPPAVRRDFVLWMVLCYLGETGGYGWYGRNRPVFYSDTAVPRIERMFTAAENSIRSDVEVAADDSRVKSAIKNKSIARRYNRLLDLVGG